MISLAKATDYVQFAAIRKIVAFVARCSVSEWWTRVSKSLATLRGASATRRKWLRGDKEQDFLNVYSNSESIAA
jgi:hypothetical protein